MDDEQVKNLWKITSSVERIQQRLNIPAEDGPKGGWLLRFPGFKYDDFNRAGMLNVVKLDRASQSIVVLRKSDLEVNQMMFFVLGRHWNFSKRLYEQAAVNLPMTMQWRLTGVGSASMDQCITFCNDVQATSSADDINASAPLASCTSRVVNVNPLTRKPEPLPDRILSATKDITEDGERFPSVRPPTTVPEHSYCIQVRVRNDDMDVLFHTNVSSYLAYAFECAAEAAKAGYYSEILDDVAFYRPKRATSVYMSESRAGDQLDVSTWEDSDNKLLLNFAVCKLGKIINFAQIEFYNGSALALSHI